MQQNVSFTVSQEEINLNDYNYVWAQLTNRPSKTTIYNQLKGDLFLNFISKNKYIVEYKNIERIYEDGVTIINEKTLIKLEENNIYISYIEVNKDTDTFFIGEVTLIYPEDKSDIVKSYADFFNTIDNNINNTQNESDEDYIENVFTISLVEEGISLVPFLNINVSDKNIDLFYNDDVNQKRLKLINDINSYNKGLHIIYGERGTGKTSLLRNIAGSVNKDVIYVPINMVEAIVNNPDFRTFISKTPNSVLVLDDCENFFSNLPNLSIFTNCILQLIDGFQSDEFSINCILVANAKKSDSLNEQLYECNNFRNLIEIGELDNLKIQTLIKTLKLPKIKGPLKLSCVLNGIKNINTVKELGF